MGVCLISRIFLWHLFVVAGFVHESLARAFPSSALARARVLSAATLRSSLETRDVSAALLRRETSYDFLEGRSSSAPSAPDGSVFTASVVVRSQKPILTLEDIESDLVDVSCSTTEIELHFASIDALDRVAKEIEQLTDFVVVSSHLNCNEADQRAPHMVTKVTILRDRKIIILSKMSSSWKDAFSMVEVSFARRSSAQVLERRNINLKKRQVDPPTETAQPSSTKRDFPVVPPAATSAPAESKEDIEVKVIDQVIMPPEFPGSSLFIPQGVTLKCKNCTVAGSVDLSQGSFRLEDPIDNPVELVTDVIRYFEHGEIQIDVENLFAHIELSTKLDLAENGLQFSVPLPEIPITPFMIPGIVAFGPIFKPEIEMSLTLTEPLEFDYGFNVSVPNDARFTIDIGDLNNSTTQGFDRTKFSSLPYQAQVPTGFEFNISFRPEVLLGVNSLIGGTTGGVGAFFTIPSINVKVEQLKNVDGKCNPLPTSSALPGDDDDDDDEKNRIPTLEDLIGNFTNIVPTVELNVGVLAELEIGIGAFQKKLEADHTIISKEFALPTACLAFNQEKKSFASPTPPPPPQSNEPGSGPGVARPKDGTGGSNRAFGDSAEARVILWGSMLTATLVVVGFL
ncbi:GPI anchored protein [Blastomyces dermatitidis ER-3]|uniref:GPI anchored protein n=2 Tax=Ajellomyces dermatitidis TaxID=5039 RepID=F2TRW0_AJEDA|nr:GPI anchored protein [Blastomyces dermatitidis ER-3]EEQ89743.1 GPI anchored protein [Blastomyces dermatitidis ER-3]EGE85973.1 GPI anchored protein [Blastomyces dermatitidis ATCC 18188]